jgi:hypothetical protein
MFMWMLHAVFEVDGEGEWLKGLCECYMIDLIEVDGEREYWMFM